MRCTLAIKGPPIKAFGAAWIQLETDFRRSCCARLHPKWVECFITSISGASVPRIAVPYGSIVTSRIGPRLLTANWFALSTHASCCSKETPAQILSKQSTNTPAPNQQTPKLEDTNAKSRLLAPLASHCNSSHMQAPVDRIRARVQQ
jgi:hypothetical protein